MNENNNVILFRETESNDVFSFLLQLTNGTLLLQGKSRTGKTYTLQKCIDNVKTRWNTIGVVGKIIHVNALYCLDWTYIRELGLKIEDDKEDYTCIVLEDFSHGLRILKHEGTESLFKNWFVSTLSHSNIGMICILDTGKDVLFFNDENMKVVKRVEFLEYTPEQWKEICTYIVGHVSGKGEER